MARLPLLSRRRSDTASAAAPVVPGQSAVQGRPPNRGLLRRERRALTRLRERKLRDLGGLMVEMYRRSIFREELLSESCADLVGIEDRLAAIELLLSPRRAPERRCVCGAPALPGARFCPNCGRPLTSQVGEETMIEPPAVES